MTDKQEIQNINWHKPNRQEYREMLRKESVKRQEQHDGLSTMEKIKKLDDRLGPNVGAKKERAKLKKQLEQEEVVKIAAEEESKKIGQKIQKTAKKTAAKKSKRADREKKRNARKSGARRTEQKAPKKHKKAERKAPPEPPEPEEVMVNTKSGFSMENKKRPT